MTNRRNSKLIMTDTQSENTHPAFKIHLRNTALDVFGDPPRVFDAFCGEGEMYRAVYEHRAEKYIGVDISRTFYIAQEDRHRIITADNREVIRRPSMLADINVLDLDAYGSPWHLAFDAARKFRGRRWLLIATEGNARRGPFRFGNASRLAAAVLKIPLGMKVPGIVYWWPDVLAYMLKEVARRCAGSCIWVREYNGVNPATYNPNGAGMAYLAAIFEPGKGE